MSLDPDQKEKQRTTRRRLARHLAVQVHELALRQHPTTDTGHTLRLIEELLDGALADQKLEQLLELRRRLASATTDLTELNHRARQALNTIGTHAMLVVEETIHVATVRPPANRHPEGAVEPAEPTPPRPLVVHDGTATELVPILDAEQVVDKVIEGIVASAYLPDSASRRRGLLREIRQELRNQLALDRLYYCAAPSCPGRNHQASQQPHRGCPQ